MVPTPLASYFGFSRRLPHTRKKTGAGRQTPRYPIFNVVARGPFMVLPERTIQYKPGTDDGMF